MPLQPPGYPSDPPISIAELSNLAHEKPQKPSNPRYSDELKCKLAAQLWYYGVQEKQDPGFTPLPSVKKIVKDAIKAGKVVDNAPRIQEYKEALRKRDEAFRSLPGPAERAEFDADLFVQYYFTVDGNPIHSAEPVTLKRYQGDAFKIAIASRSVPGLQVELARHTDSKYTVILGWDGALLRRKGREIEEATKAEQRQKEVQERDRKWQEAVDSHEELVTQTKKKLKGQKKSSGKAKSQSSRLSQFAGSYVIRCDNLESYYETDPPTIDIESSGPTSDTIVAAVDFGIVEGTMLLSLSEEVLDQYIQQSDEDEEYGEFIYEVTPATQSGKRKASTTTAKRGRPPKKAKPSATFPRRLHYRFRGRETGEGEIFFRPYKGCFDFDDTFTSFKGKADIPYVGSDADMEGMKTDNEPSAMVEDWHSFSEAAHEHARTARWH